MKYFGDSLSEKHKELSGIIRKKDKFEEAKNLFLELHAALHMSCVSGTAANEVDSLFADLSPCEYAVMPTNKDDTIAWTVWHITRIEDLTLNILVAESEQVFNADWQKRINTSCTDTGNSMTSDEVMKLSNEINSAELLAYRNAVGKRTREIVGNLTADSLKRKVSGADEIKRIGGVTAESEWLLDYWGKKDVAGILLMPPTRHLIVHLNNCCKWKSIIRSR